MPPILIIIGAVAVIVVVLALVLGQRKPAGEELIDERIGVERPRGKKKQEEREGATARIGAAVDRAVAGRGFAQNLATQLARADLKLTVGEFLTISALLSIGLGFAAYIMKRPVFIPVGIIGGFFIPRIYIGSLQSKRLKLFNGQLADALNLMVNSLRAGYSTIQAMEVISKEMPQPIAGEFGRAVLEMQLGLPFDQAMANLLRRMPSADLDLVITAMSVQREVGGNLAEVLDSIAFTIRERIRIKGDIQVLTAQGRASGMIVTVLPFAVGGFVYLYNPNFMGLMFTDPCGWIMIGTGLVLIVIGYLVINKIVNIEV